MLIKVQWLGWFFKRPFIVLMLRGVLKFKSGPHEITCKCVAFIRQDHYKCQLQNLVTTVFNMRTS